MQDLLDCNAGLLIGYDCSQALTPRNVISGGGNEPYGITANFSAVYRPGFLKHDSPVHDSPVMIRPRGYQAEPKTMKLKMASDLSPTFIW